MSFGSEGRADWLSFLPRVVARGLSAFGLFKSQRENGRLPGIDEARWQGFFAETNRASLVATIVGNYDDSGIPYYVLRVANRGDAEAHAITLKVDGMLPSEHPATRAEYGYGEAERMAPHAYCEYPLMLRAGVQPPFAVEITWTDDSGHPGVCRSTISI